MTFKEGLRHQLRAEEKLCLSRNTFSHKYICLFKLCELGKKKTIRKPFGWPNRHNKIQSCRCLHFFFKVVVFIWIWLHKVEWRYYLAPDYQSRHSHLQVILFSLCVCQTCQWWYLMLSTDNNKHDGGHNSYELYRFLHTTGHASILTYAKSKQIYSDFWFGSSLLVGQVQAPNWINFGKLSWMPWWVSVDWKT